MAREIQDRTYQDEAVQASLSAFETSDRAQLHMCCASGKTVVQAKLLKKYLESTPIGAEPPVFTVFVPNLGLIRQMEKTYKSVLGDNADYLGIGTDRDTKEDREAAPDRMSMTTSPAEANASMVGRQKPLVVFCTYQSSPTLSEALVQHNGKIQDVSIAIFDEAHRTAGLKTQGSPFSYPLFNENLSASKRLFLSSTPNTVEADQDGTQHKISMDDEEIYGKKVYDYSYSRALRDGVVSPFRIQAPVITKAEIQAYRDLKGLDEGDDKTIISELALRKVMETTGQDRILTFHNTIAKSEAFAQRMETLYGDEGFFVTHIDGESSASDRERAFAKMGTQPSIVTSVRALGEGADAPGIQGILFSDPRQSTIEVIQNIGRLQRVDPDNPGKIGSIICPVIIDEASKESFEDQLLKSPYANIFTAAEALRASSDVASHSVSQASREYGRTGTIPSDDRLGIELIGGTILSEEKMQQLQDAIRIQTFESVVDEFQVNLGQIDRMIAEERQMPGPDSDLGLFVATQRERLLRGQLSDKEIEEIERLDRIEVELEKERPALTQEPTEHIAALEVKPADPLSEKEQWAAAEADRLADEKARNTVVTRLEDFYATHGRNPNLHTPPITGDEFELASKVKQAEDAYVDAYFGDPKGHNNGYFPEQDGNSPFYKLNYGQSDIAKTRFFFADQDEEMNLVTGHFKRTPDHKGWRFIASPGKSGPDGEIKLFNTGRLVPAASFEMHLTDEQSTQVEALGPRHKVTIDITRAGKSREPHRDGAMNSIKSATIDRYESTRLDWVVGRLNDRAVSGRPAYSEDNLRSGAISHEDPITNLTPSSNQRLCSAGQFMREMELVRERSFEGRYSNPQIRTLAATPGFSWHESASDDIDGQIRIKDTAQMISKHLGREVLGDLSARKGDNGLANTLREMDKTILKFERREQSEDEFAPSDIRLMRVSDPDGYRSLLRAAKISSAAARRAPVDHVQDYKPAPRTRPTPNDLDDFR